MSALRGVFAARDSDRAELFCMPSDRRKAHATNMARAAAAVRKRSRRGW
jgi:hypothetical protein